MKNILYQESIVENKHLFHIMKITALILFIFVYRNLFSNDESDCCS